ncbi:unnamed protein product [Rotaria magnacalcarata]|uniref:EF-hand domain-containing protein n=1 Tax=Rotaria magnacalcarata TaxID=392030 RepID=A0A816WC48_9BILA|nr:unnamed protein product [Rotaria magnacalcarata]CAF1666094.1 unnamed protein product [Rotaria magnacalcarata]CAF1946115.1 unnamed protein product [Rotaria magnacalcarata]CAF2132273.1 unnamed protein product [Rotaria magnacalcarata]CAF2135354.1 unnamed protein product [Rotaria magnacalcarata]
MGNKPATKLRPADWDDLHQRTKFSDAEIQEWFKCFHKDCPTGQLTLEEFKSIYAQFFPAGDSSIFAEHVFKHFNTNGNNKISFCDFLSGLSITAKGDLKQKLEWTFGLYDADKDGYISRQEMLIIVDSIYKMIGPVMQLPEDESTPEKRTNKIFSTYDIDRDGKLSPDEFISGALSDPSIRHLLNVDKIQTMTTDPVRSSENNHSSTTRLHT